MCTFWLVEALTRAGRTDRKRLDQARLIFEKMLGFGNHLGLYAEETGAHGEALGNFPQAFTHLALISAAFNLDRRLSNRNW
jgi:GH15 family glucan-1,4-alpha-glucosidase